MILAADRNWAIGNSANFSGLPWPNIPEDFKHFQKETKAVKNLIIGRYTYEIIKILSQNQLLQGRNLIVLSKTISQYDDPRIAVCRNIESALEVCPKEDRMIGGGKIVFEQNIRLVDEIILTRINAAHPADCFIDPKIFKQFEEDESRQKVLCQGSNKPRATAHYFIRKK